MGYVVNYYSHYFMKFTENIILWYAYIMIVLPNKSPGGEEGRGSVAEENLRDKFGTHALSLSALSNRSKEFFRANTVPLLSKVKKYSIFFRFCVIYKTCFGCRMPVFYLKSQEWNGIRTPLFCSMCYTSTVYRLVDLCSILCIFPTFCTPAWMVDTDVSKSIQYCHLWLALVFILSRIILDYFALGGRITE